MQPVHTLTCSWTHRINGTAEHFHVAEQIKKRLFRFAYLRIDERPLLPHPFGVRYCGFKAQLFVLVFHFLSLSNEVERFFSCFR